MRINTNVAALNSYNQLQGTNNAMNKSLERLSSGKRINRASDDAAGLAISEKMNSQVKGLSQAQRNAQDGISMIQTAEGALKESHSILQRMRELSVQAANDSNTAGDREEIQKEITQLTGELDRIADTTEFNTKNLLDGSQADKSSSADLDTSGFTNVSATLNGNVAVDGKYVVNGSAGGTIEIYDGDNTSTLLAANTSGTTVDYNGISFEISAGVAAAETGSATQGASAAGLSNDSLKFQIGANGGQDTDLDIKAMKAQDLSVSTANLNVKTQANAEAAINTLDNAIAKVSGERSKLGAKQNRLEHTINNLSVAEENLTAANSRIKDVDMASEMMNMSKQRILSQAGTAMLAQANQKPQGVLQLLG